MADRCDEAERLARSALDWLPDDDRDLRYWEWMQETFDLDVGRQPSLDRLGQSSKQVEDASAGPSR